MGDVIRQTEATPPEDKRVPWSQLLARYKYPSPLKSWWQVVNTVVPFCVLWYLMYLGTFRSYWLTLLLAIPTAGLLVRVFIIQHDCGHHSFFRSRRANDLLGSLCCLFTLTPYHFWKRSHARHHASSGNLSHRGHGDVAVLTVDEFLARSRFGRFRYRLYRNPFVMFGLGASYLFILHYRVTLGVPKNWRRERTSIYATNLGLLLMVGLASWTIGLGTFLMVHGPLVILAAATGCWLFFIQHQFENAYWQPQPTWNFTQSALQGSSYYRLPRVLQWFTGNIGFHHIHHLDSRIPNYNLPLCYAEEPDLQQAVTLGIRDSLRCTRLKLWDTAQQRMVSFKEAYTKQPASSVFQKSRSSAASVQQITKRSINIPQPLPEAR